MADAEIKDAFCGADRSWTSGIYGKAGSLVTTYLPGATLAAECWAGDDTAVLFAPTVAWHDDDPASGEVDVSIAGTDTAALDPGDYKVRLGITAGGVTRRGWLAVLRLLAAPGTATPTPTYCTLDDLKLYAGSILDNLADDADQAGFVEQRGRAREWIDRTAMARARWVLEEQARRHAPIVAVDPIVPADGLDGGPIWGPSVYPDTTLRAQLAAIEGHLAADALIVDPAVREAAARYAASLVLDRQFGTHEGSKTSYRALADAFRSRARRILAATTLRLDTDSDGDGIPDLELAPC